MIGTFLLLFLTCLIDALEKRHMATCDIPGAFMQADIDEFAHMKLEGELAEILMRLNPAHQKFITCENGKPVICTELSKALHGTLQASLFLKDPLVFLKEQGFETNSCNLCIMNKNVNGKQCTVRWHVDDLKISHVDESVVKDSLSELQKKHGKEAPLTITCRKAHDCLSMTINFTVPGKANSQCLTVLRD